MKKPIRYLIGLAALGLVGYNSVYIKKLDEVKAATAGKSTFKAESYAETFWNTKLLPVASQQATDLSTLVTQLKTDKEKAFTDHSHALGIGNIRYFLVKGTGTVSAVNPDDITVSLSTGETVRLATEYIYSNAARDASGLIQITEFDNTTDLNNVSAAVNNLIRQQIVPSLKAKAKPGQQLTFVGALELNRAHLHIDKLTLIPIFIE